MADPVRYDIGYSFSNFQTSNPSTPLPAPRLDDELANISTSIESLRSSVMDVRRSDGHLANQLVDYDSLSNEIRYLFDAGAVTNAELLADAVEATEDNVVAAQAAQAAAEAAAAIATATVDPAPFFAGEVVPAVTIASATTTDIGSAVSTHVVISGTATITSFGSQRNRLRFVRFNGSSVLTHNATTLILLNKRTRSMRAGDQGIYLSDASGNWRELHFSRNTTVYYAEFFSTLAHDGATDDMAALQAIIDLAAANGGGRVVLAPGRTYRLVSNSGVTDLGLIIKNGVTLDVNGATVNLECTGSVYGMRLQSFSHVIGPGTVAVTVSSLPGAAGCYHTPISAAVNYGEVTNVAALGNYVNASNWSVRDLTLNSVRNDGNGMCFSVVGGQNHGLVENITIANNSSIFCGVGCDWGSVGAINSSNFTTSRAAFDANTAYTVHPHDIVIRRIKIGALTGTGSHGVRLSGCYKIKIEDVEVDSTVGAGFAHHGGDCGFEFAEKTQNVARRAYRGTTIRNFHVYDTTVGVGFLFDCLADNLKIAIAGGYVALTAAIGTTDAVLENCRSWSTSGATAGRGFWLKNFIGGVMRNCLAHRGSFGVNIEAGVDDFTIEGGEFALSHYDGITAGNADAPQNLAVLGAKLWGNGQSGSGRAGIYLSTCINPRVERCIIGTRGGDATQSYGINVDSTCVNAMIEVNHIAGVKAAGTGMVLAGATDFGCFRLVRGNTFDASASTKMTGVIIIPIEIMHSIYGSYRRFLTSRASAFSLTPSSGTWVVGDTIEFVDPLSTGWSGTKCTVAGTPGTWKNYGQLN